MHSEAGCQEQISVSSTAAKWSFPTEKTRGQWREEMLLSSLMVTAGPGFTGSTRNGVGTTGHQQRQPEMLLCFCVIHVLQFFSSNTGPKCSKSGTKRQLPEGEEFGEGEGFLVLGVINHWTKEGCAPCDDTWFLSFSSLTDTLMLIKF